MHRQSLIRAFNVDDGLTGKKLFHSPTPTKRKGKDSKADEDEDLVSDSTEILPSSDPPKPDKKGKGKLSAASTPKNGKRGKEKPPSSVAETPKKKGKEIDTALKPVEAILKEMKEPKGHTLPQVVLVPFSCIFL